LNRSLNYAKLEEDAEFKIYWSLHYKLYYNMKKKSLPLVNKIILNIDDIHSYYNKSNTKYQYHCIKDILKEDLS